MIPEEHRPRLNRLERLFTHHPLYFVTACTEERHPILANPRVHECFRQFCEAGLARGVFVGNYVLMPDHLHLFVVLGEEYVQARASALAERRYSGAPVAAVCDRRLLPLSDWMKSLKNSLSKAPRRTGRKASSTMCSAPRNRMPRNGSMWSRTRCERNWLRRRTSGRSKGRFIRWQLAGMFESNGTALTELRYNAAPVAAVCDRRVAPALANDAPKSCCTRNSALTERRYSAWTSD